jgi:putative FmdB family regulatory protein
MPIYAYRCDDCGFAKDALQKVSDAPLTDCPSCGKPSFKKQLTAAGFQLKGTGWYVTDFRGNGNAGAPAAGTSAPAPAVTAAEAGAAATAAPAAAPVAASSSGTGSAKPAAT